MKVQLLAANPGAGLHRQPAFSENIIVIGCDVNGNSLPCGSPKAVSLNRGKPQNWSHA